MGFVVMTDAFQSGFVVQFLVIEKPELTIVLSVARNLGRSILVSSCKLKPCLSHPASVLRRIAKSPLRST